MKNHGFRLVVLQEHRGIIVGVMKLAGSCNCSNEKLLCVSQEKKSSFRYNLQRTGSISS
jgi:hypothetical protein